MTEGDLKGQDMQERARDCSQIAPGREALIRHLMQVALKWAAESLDPDERTDALEIELRKLLPTLSRDADYWAHQWSMARSAELAAYREIESLGFAPIVEAAREHLESLDEWPEQLVPINRKGPTVNALRAALTAFEPAHE